MEFHCYEMKNYDLFVMQYEA